MANPTATVDLHGVAAWMIRAHVFILFQGKLVSVIRSDHKPFDTKVSKLAHSSGEVADNSVHQLTREQVVSTLTQPVDLLRTHHDKWRFADGFTQPGR